jgi:magnesium chelatase family protein
MGAETLSKLDIRPTFRPHSSLLALPGAGKSMLARRLTAILPAMSLAEALDTTRIRRVALPTGTRPALVTARPFRAPHHTIADVGLIDGGRVPPRGNSPEV